MKSSLVPQIPLQIASLLSLVLALVVIAPTTYAQEQNPVAVNLTAKKVVGKDGKEVLEPADKAKPGDVIQYEAVYRNSGQTAVKGLQATVPVPVGLTYVANSAKPAGALASLDGKTFQPIPLLREVKKPDGTTEKQPVPLAEYRALRWSIEPLEGGKEVAVQLRAAVRTNSPAK